MLNVGMVDNPEFWQTIFEFRGPKHVRFPLPGFSQSRVITFFKLVRAFAFFLFKATTTLLVLWIFTSNISPHSAEHEIEDHKRKVDTNRFVSEIH